MKMNTAQKAPPSSSLQEKEKQYNAFSSPVRTPVKKPSPNSVALKPKNQQVTPKALRPKRDCFDDMLVIQPIQDEVTIKMRLEKLKADYLKKNAIVIRKKLLLAALNKGMRYK